MPGNYLDWSFILGLTIIIRKEKGREEGRGEEESGEEERGEEERGEEGRGEEERGEEGRDYSWEVYMYLASSITLTPHCLISCSICNTLKGKGTRD